MDTFMDKLSEKLTAQEMINANAAADAEEMNRLKEQIKEYEDCLKQIQKANMDLQAINEQISSLPDGVIAPQLERLVKESVAKLKEFKSDNEALKEIKTILEQKTSASNENVHKECVKVYRNVQAVIVEECGKQTESFESQLSRVRSNVSLIFKISIVSLIASVAGVLLQLFA